MVNNILLSILAASSITVASHTSCYSNSCEVIGLNGKGIINVSGISMLNDNFKLNLILIKTISKSTFKDKPILAQLSVAQAILESNLQSKPSYLAKKYNNLFGIKGKGTAGSVRCLTNEFYGGKYHRLYQEFAFNTTLNDSFEQYKKLLSLPRYMNLQTATTFEQAARWIQKDGYATDPLYYTDLMNIYKKYLK